MESRNDGVEQWSARKDRPRAQRLECRQCGVICERVVSPWRCLKAHYPCVYAYETGDATFFGCLHKVFAPELDLAAFGGEAVSGGQRTDPYGPIRATRSPRPHCPVGIERAYSLNGITGGCSNPAFACGGGLVSGGLDAATAKSGRHWQPDSQS